MNSKDVADWLAFCDGRGDISPEQFSTMFMGLYLEPLTDEDKRNFQSIFATVPNSDAALEKMLRMDELVTSKSDDELLAIVKRGLDEKRQLIRSKDVVAAFDFPLNLVADESQFQRACDGELNRQFFHELGNCFVSRMSNHPRNVQALSNAFYGLANNVHLQWTLTADLIDIPSDFSHYFELYLVAADYAFGDNEILVINYRACAPQ